VSKRVDARARLEEVDALFSALAHSARRQILLAIVFRGGRMTAGEIADRFHHSWPTTSRHLRVLEAAGLIAHQRAGRAWIYRINRRKLAAIKDFLRWFEEGVTPRTPQRR
jgi:DNA-binding transcriptional ArsR family regulator